ncbi:MULTISPECIES: hypothetical protein [unclassified Brachybacterium]|uniref:hypothetical protein n=1 Tax=unclassified Brachybacterium TaxID=2623841 RepID=UPI00360F91C0
MIQLVGLAAPIIGAAFLVLFRQRAPGPVTVGLLACAAGIAASIIGLLSEKSVFLGRDLEGMTHHLEMWGMVRLTVIALTVVLLMTAAGLGPHVSPTWIPLLLTGGVSSAAGAALRFVPIDLGPEHEGLTFLALMVSEALQFGLIGIGMILMCLAVVASRPAKDGRDEPLALARRIAGSLWRLRRSLLRS